MKKKKIKIENERLMLAKEWASEDRIDPQLFLWWKTPMTRSQYEKIKIKTYRTR